MPSNRRKQSKLTKDLVAVNKNSPGTAALMAKKFKSDAFEAIHSAVSGMYEVGSVSEETMRHFDEVCLSMPPD